MSISFPLSLDFFRGGRHLTDKKLAEALNLAESSSTSSFTNQTTVTQKSDFGPVVGGVITLNTDWLYNVLEPIDLGSDVLEGHNVTIVGSASFQSTLSTASPNALISTDAPGYMILIDLFCSNSLGPFIDYALGNTPGSFGFMDFVLFNGDPLQNGTGVGSIGVVNGCDRIQWNACFFTGCIDGLQLDGTLGEVVIKSSPFTVRAAAPSYTAIKVLATATTDLFLLDGVRLTTASASDRFINLSPSATALTSMRMSGCTIRGPGTFMDAASRQGTDPLFLVNDNEGSTAPTDSGFTATASFLSNTTITDMSAVTPGDLVPIGNGESGHTLFNGGASVERFSLSGAETQLQKFTYNGTRKRKFRIVLHCQMTRAGGGSVSVSLAIAHKGVVFSPSVTPTEVANTSAPGRTSATIELDPGDTLELRVANNTNQVNITILSAFWDVQQA